MLAVSLFSCKGKESFSSGYDAERSGGKASEALPLLKFAEKGISSVAPLTEVSLAMN